MSIEQNRTLIEVWNKAKSINGYDPDIWRQDFAGAWIRRDAYGMIFTFREKGAISATTARDL